MATLAAADDDAKAEAEHPVLKMQIGDLSLWLAYRQPSGLERSDLGRSAGFEGFAVRNRRVVGQL